jgi:nucleotide-binding universal stress UspA family protein
VKILIAVDGSVHSLAAIETLLKRLEWFRAPVELALVYVHPALPYKHAAAWAGKEAIRSYYEEESDAALAAARARLDERGIGYVVEKRVGDAGEEIVKAAAEKGYELIVMGTHGHTALANLVMGSVATKVVAGSTVPVLLMK